MRRTIISLAVLASVFTAADPLRAQGLQCSTVTLQGAYGFHGIATIVPAGTPRAIIGTFSFNGYGKWTANLTLNDNGTILLRPDSGTYVINGDCTGTMFPASGGSVEIMVVDGGREAYHMRSNPANIVLYGAMKKVLPAGNEGR